MTPSIRKRVLISAACVVGVLIVALLVVPFLIDPNVVKSQIAAQAKKATGRDLTIDGPVTLSLLPLPSVTLGGVRFLNAPGAKNVDMVEAKSIRVVPSALALLRGAVELSEVNLIEPRIVLEIDADGRPNWEFTPPSGQAVPSADKPGPSRPPAPGKLTVESGNLIFVDARAGLSIAAEKASVVATLGSLGGPYVVAASATVNGAPLRLDLSIGARAGDGLPSALALEAGGGKLTFKGAISEVGPNATATGFASVLAESLSAFIATLAGLAGDPPPVMPHLLASKFSFEGDVDISRTRIAARDFKMALAGDRGYGDFAVALKPTPSIDGKLVLPRFDLDGALAALSETSARSATTQASTRGAPTTTAGASVLAAITARLSIEAEEVRYRKQVVRDVGLELDARGGMIAMPKLAATLPGDTVLQARSTLSGDPAKPTVAGDFTLAGSKLRDTLDWLAVDVSSVPADRLKRFSTKGSLGSTGGKVEVSNAAFELDDVVRGTGGVVVNFTVPLSIMMRLEIDTIDLDPYRPSADAQTTPGASRAPAQAATPAPPGALLGLKLKINRATYKKGTIGGVDLDLATNGRTLEVKDVKVSNLGGARLAMRGNVTGVDTTMPRVDIALNFEAPDMNRVLEIAGVTAPTDLGRVTASGSVAGTIEALTFREFRLAAQGQSAQLDGTLAMPGAAQGRPTSIGYKGRIAAASQTIEGTVEAKVSARPSITADLMTTFLDLDRLGSPAPAPGRASRPAAGAAPTGSPALDSSAMQAFDASLKLHVGTLVSSPLRLSNADIAATLKDGVLTVQHLKAGLYGGTLDLSGTVNGSKPALAFEIAGSASNIGLGEMLRTLSGTNQYGGAVKATIDGRLSANGIALRGGGTTTQQIKASLAGGAQLGGYVFVGTDKTLAALGTAAAGAVGGAIDNTLAGALGFTGIKGGIGIGNLLNAASLLLNRFVNRDNPVSGHVDIAGGMLTDKSLTVSGNRATADIATRTNFATSTTDTTINFMIAEDGSAPYIITTARGPFSRLSYNAVRGSAKDPPGMANTITNGIPSVVPNFIPGLAGSGGEQGPHINIPIPNIFGR